MHLPRLLRSFSAKGTALVGSLLLLFSMAVGFASYRAGASGYEFEATNGLSALATAKQHAIEADVSRMFDILGGFTLPGLSDSVEELLAGEGTRREELKTQVEERLRIQLGTTPLLVSAQIHTRDLVPIAVTDPEHILDPAVDLRMLEIANQRPAISSPFRDGSRFFVDLAAPLLDGHGQLMAILVIRKEAVDLLSITGDHVGLGETGETVLGRRVGNEVEFIIPLRFQAEPGNVTVAAVSGARAGPMIAATAGQAGMQLGLLDYRDVPVAAAYRPIAGTDWGMVVKQDLSEIFAPVDVLRTNLILAILAITALGGLMIYPALRILFLPLRNLQEATDRIAKGDLTARVGEMGDLETAALAASFNRMADHLAETQTELERRNEELREFAYVVSHDLKAPLRGVAGISQWLQEDLAGKLEPDSERHLQLMRDRVLRMDALINGLLDYSRIGWSRDDPMEVDLGALVARVKEDLAPPEGFAIMQTSALPTLKADSIRIAQVFQNLIGNAIQHHPSSEGTVQVAARDAGQFWEFSIADDGLGIDPAYHAQIFAVFNQLSSAGKADSTGIGLAVVKKIVEDVGGTVWVESTGEPGEGSVFHFTWPKGNGEET